MSAASTSFSSRGQEAYRLMIGGERSSRFQKPFRRKYGTEYRLRAVALLEH